MDKAAVSLGSGLRTLPPPCPAGQNSLPTFFRPTNFVLKFDLKRQRMFLRNPCGARVPQKKGEGKEALLVLALLASPPHAYFEQLCYSIFSNFAAKRKFAPLPPSRVSLNSSYANQNQDRPRPDARNGDGGAGSFSVELRPPPKKRELHAATVATYIATFA